MTRPQASINRVFLYRLSSPVLFIPWIWTQFFASAISWALIALYSVWSWNSTLYWAPTWTMAIFFVLVPFQESQEPIIEVLELITENIDDFMNDTIFPIIEDLFYIVQPACWGHNFLWDGAVVIGKIAIYNPIKLFLRMALPPGLFNFDFFKTIPFQASAFPLTTEIDTSNSPDWIVGPYGRNIPGRNVDPGLLDHPLLNGTRRIDQTDPYARALIHWLRTHQPQEKHGVVRLVIPASVLDEWTNPATPPEYRRAISEQLLRKIMDQSAELEQPTWWEKRALDPDAQDIDPEEPESPWARVFEVPSRRALDNMGVVRLDKIPDLEKVYGKTRVRGVKVPRGTIAYRYLSDAKGTRDLNFTFFQRIAEVFANFFDVIVTVLVALWQIALSVANFLFKNIEDFFNSALDFVANVFNQIWAQFLKLPCLKFNSVSVFAISVLDCICGPLQQAASDLGGGIGTWFNYKRPKNIAGLPQAILSCVGLGCIDVSLITQPNAFAAQLFGECMGLSNAVVCCIIKPTNCFVNTVKVLTQCNCGGQNGKLNVSPPKCKYPGTNSADAWVACFVVFIMKRAPIISKNALCRTFNCRDSKTPALDAVDRFIQCIGQTLLNIGPFIDALTPILDDIFGLFDDDGFISFFERREPVNPHQIPNRVRGQRNPLNSYDRRAKYSRDAPWIEDGRGGRGRNQVWTLHDRIAYVRAQRQNNTTDVDIIGNTSNNTNDTGAAATISPALRLLQEENDGISMLTNYDAEEYGTGGTVAMLLDLEQKARRRQELMFYHDLDMSPAELYTYQERVRDNTQRFESLGAMRQLEVMVGSRSRSKYRPQVQMLINQRVYSNPYIRAATGRLVEILRDLVDFAEYRIYGPDPFTLPPEDADPEEDPRVDNTKRYVDETVSHQHTYAFYKQAIQDNPYHSGLYKMLFQLGDADALARGDQDVIDTWQAMTMHRNNPLFHMGRIMASSRQLCYAYMVLLNEITWDADTFSFHFPNAAQMQSLMMQIHLPAFMDDLRSAVSGLFNVRAIEAHEALQQRALEFTEETIADPVGAASRYGPTVRTYSWMVQAEVAIRTVVTRLLSPRHLEPMLDELSTRSPLHARYCDRMRNRVQALRAASERAHKSLEQKIVEWRARQTGTMTVRNETTGETEILNRPWTFELDPVAHPDAGNRTLQPGDRVRFVDGYTGVFVGTVGSGVSLSPTRNVPGLREAGVWGGGVIGINTRAIQILSVAKGFIKVIQWAITNWRLIATALVSLVTSPWGQVFGESWINFIYFRIVKPLYSEGLRGIFGSLSDIIDLVVDFQLLNETIGFFLINELFRYGLCFAWAALVVASVFLPLYIMNLLLSFGMLTPFVTWAAVVVGLIAFTFPYCPPEQILENNRLTQLPWQYFDDIMECFGDAKFNQISIGKDVYNGICSVKTDCPGNAPCICENKGGQYSSAFAAFTDDTACGTAAAPTGQCLCWPKLDCQFLFPRIGTNRLFDVDCSEDYGYRINKITWYQTSDYLKVFRNAYLNFWISVRYVTRLLSLARGINPFLLTILVTFGAFIMFYADITAGVLIMASASGYQYALPLWRDLTIDHIIPGLERVEGSFWPLSILAEWIIRFMRFPNFTDAEPLGTPRSGEGVCFFFNMGTMFGGFSTAFWFWGTILALIWYGLGPIVWFIFNNVMVPVRIAIAPFWLSYQRSRMSRHFNKAKDIIRRAVPSWARRGASAGGSTLYNIGTNLMPNAPNTRLNRWLQQYYPDPREAWKQQVLGPRAPEPRVIDGRMAGYGAGTLNYETDPSAVHLPPAGIPTPLYAPPTRRLRRRRQPPQAPPSQRRRRPATVTTQQQQQQQQPPRSDRAETTRHDRDSDASNATSKKKKH